MQRTTPFDDQLARIFWHLVRLAHNDLRRGGRDGYHRADAIAKNAAEIATTDRRKAARAALLLEIRCYGT